MIIDCTPLGVSSGVVSWVNPDLIGAANTFFISQGDFGGTTWASYVPWLYGTVLPRWMTRPGSYGYGLGDICGGLTGMSVDTTRALMGFKTLACAAVDLWNMESITNNPAQVAVLINPAMLAMHQDPACIPGWMVSSNATGSVWVKPLENGDRAVGFPNESGGFADILDRGELQIPLNPWSVRDELFGEDAFDGLITGFTNTLSAPVNAWGIQPLPGFGQSERRGLR